MSFPFVRMRCQTGGVDPRQFSGTKATGTERSSRTARASGGWRSRDSYVSRQERESLPVPLAVYVFANPPVGAGSWSDSLCKLGMSLCDGTDIHAIIPSLALGGSCLTICSSRRAAVAEPAGGLQFVGDLQGLDSPISSSAPRHPLVRIDRPVSLIRTTVHVDPLQPRRGMTRRRALPLRAL